MLRLSYQHERKILLCRRLLSTVRSPYQVLDIPSSATKADIKKAYIEKAKKCHPDLFPDNEEKTRQFQELQEAYSILSDTRKRAQYAQAQRQTQSRGPGMHQGPGPRHPYHDFTESGGSYGSNPFGQRYPGGGPQRRDPMHEMLQQMLRAQARQQQAKFGGKNFEKEAKIRGQRWDTIILRLLLLYVVLWMGFVNLRLSTARQSDIDPALREHQTQQLDQIMAARMMGTTGREQLARQREVRELMERYHVNDGKKDNTMSEIDEDTP